VGASDQLSHEESEIEPAGVNQQPLQNVGVAASIKRLDAGRRVTLVGVLHGHADDRAGLERVRQRLCARWEP
jgi:hypothetical protein